MINIDIVTNLAPHYRERLWLLLLAEKGFSIRIVFGENPSSSIRQIDFSSPEWAKHHAKLARVKNVYFRNALIWQRKVIRTAVTTNADIFVLLGDMHVVSNWLAAVVLLIRRKKVIFWGHGLYGNEKPLRKMVRLAFLRLAQFNLVYGERAVRLLTEAGLSNRRVTAVYNSLDYDRQVSLRQLAIDKQYYASLGVFKSPERPVLVFIGRLTAHKKLDRLINVVNELNHDGRRFNLVLIGDGPERENLERLAFDAQDYVYFAGPRYEEEEIASFLANADLCISPGEVGLTALHSLTYGTPVCTHGNMAEQMPEVEAVTHGRTGILFDQSARGLREGIESWFSMSKDREEVRRLSYEVIDRKFNPHNQVRIFRDVFSRLTTN